MKLSTTLLIGLSQIGLIGCSAMPSQGPMAGSISTEHDEQSAPGYSIVDVTPQVSDSLSASAPRLLNTNLGAASNGRAVPRVQIGDTLRLQIWESDERGLFSAPGSKSTDLAATVSASGQIYVPYVGTIDVLNLELEEVRRRVAKGLQGKTVDPEVVVNLADSGAQSVSVLGDVRAPGRFALRESGLRLVDAVALAGGAKEPGYDTMLRLVRGGNVAEIALDDAVSIPRNNVWLLPGDTVELTYEARSFSVFGAVKSSGLKHFETREVTLAEALAASGGLNDSLADRGGVFLFRFEPAEHLREFGVARPPRSHGPLVPVIYRLDFSQTEAFFMASRIQVRDRDIIYAANAPGAEVSKFIEMFLRPLMASASDYTDLQ
ncbi:SLBB domain-containing protein [Salipiger mangrovisoli]|uniref:Polysaccharide export protein n=1 Tax=Salipiger mangrovisoli TaxID=2865933 RepID=A0ABR9XAI0_9RHOB|nr:polysaccharide biosynthesis/export family protein [Salipiger mangrovisoli]MBE9640523.1 polysaccharide export protein [Salipiger mangrovisoli]